MTRAHRPGKQPTAEETCAGGRLYGTVCKNAVFVHTHTFFGKSTHSHTHRFVFSLNTAKKAAIKAPQANMERQKMSLSFVSSLKDCAKTKNLYLGSRIHADIRDSGLLEKNTYLGNMLVGMYVKCGALVRAQQVFDELLLRDVVAWNTLIAGYSQQRQGQEALGCFQQMQSEGLPPDAVTYTCILKACGSTQDADMGKKIHDDVVSQGLLQKNVVLGNALVDMYAKCGALQKAQKVLEELSVRNVVSWNALIAGYAQQEQGQKALGCFQQMQSEGISPDAITYVCILKACGSKQDADMGIKIHADIVSQGMSKKEVVLGNALIDMYAKCGLLEKAQRVLEELGVRDVVSWNALIAGYAQQGQGQKALGHFQRMRSEGFSPDAITYACILKACGCTQDADMGIKIHDDIVSLGLLQTNVVLGSALVDMYAKCGLLQKAQKVLEELPVRNVVSWSALIAGYTQQEQGQEALGCFQRMQNEGLTPDVITYACILKACGSTQDVDMGIKIHDDIVSQGLLQKNFVLGNALVDLYAKCGALQKAQKVLEELPVRNVISWSALIAGYAQQGQGKEALGCFQRMQNEGLSPDGITYTCILKACGSMQDAETGLKIHADIVSQGLLKKDVVLGNALVDMYAKCGVLQKAQKVLEELCVRDVVSWNALIAGYAQQWQGQEALGCFQRMQSEGLSPDAITYACILKACGSMQDADRGIKMHADIVSQGLLQKNVVLGNSLVDMYAKCGALQKAQKVLEELPVRNVVCWSSLIAGYAQQEQGQKALGCFQRMRSEGLSPDAITYACILKACGTAQDANMGIKIHDDIVNQGLLQTNVVVGNALVDMYAKCGALQKAQKVLEELPVRNVVSWSALIAGYAQQRQGQEALGCFQRMQSEGLSPDAITYACSLKACGSMQDADMGIEIHADIVSQRLLQKNVVLGNALVDMYAKCGLLQKAQRVLEELCGRNVVSWNALIAGYAQQGQGQEALGCFQRMRTEGLSPDVITYTCILKACGCMQDADMGIKIYTGIVSQGLLQKNVMLGNALVDMYAKCGALKKAQKVLEELPVRNVVSWNALIAGYVQQEQGQKALGCFQLMQSEGLSPNAITYACILKACGSTQDADMCIKIHDDIVSQGLLQKNVILGNALVEVYAKCGVLQKAQRVLEELGVRDVVSWNALIAGYAQLGLGQEALGCFQQMRSEGISPDAITYACILKAYGSTEDADMGIKVHADIVSRGMLKNDVVLGTALVDMYAKCGLLQKAQRVLEELRVRDVVSWNALIAGYAQHEQGQKALGCCLRMHSEGLFPDAITYACILKACGSTQDADMGKNIIADIARHGLLKNDVVLGNALVGMFAKCGALQKAQKVLEELPVRNVDSWNALIAGHAEQGKGQEALGCFQRMQSERISPNSVTYTFVLKAMLTS